MTVETASRPTVSTVKETVRSTDGTRIGFARFGEGPGIVFVHGSISGRRDWFRVAESLSDRFTCFMMDRRGRGLSGNGNAEYSIEREYDDLAAVLKAAGPEPCLVAHSYGATCALGAAIRADVKKLVVYEPPLGINAPITGKALDEYHRAEEAGDLDKALEIGLREFVRLPQAKIDAIRKGKIWPKMAMLVPSWYRELVAMDGLGSSVTQYAGITAPTLLLLGTESAQQPFKDAAAALADTVPDIRIASLKGQSHMALRVAPQMVLEQVERFLAD